MAKNRTKLSAPNWIIKSEEYYISSRWLYFTHHFDASLVCGQFSLELILKCILLQNQKDWDEGHGKGHDLLLLFNILVENKIVKDDQLVISTLQHYHNYYKEFRYPEYSSGESKSGIDINVISNFDYTIFYLRKNINYFNKNWIGEYSPINSIAQSSDEFNKLKRWALFEQNNNIIKTNGRY